MRRWTVQTAGVALTILVAGCGSNADEAAVTGVSPQEAQALNDAAAMLDENGADAAVANDTTGNSQ